MNWGADPDSEFTSAIRCINQSEVGLLTFEPHPAPFRWKVPYVTLSPAPDFALFADGQFDAHFWTGQSQITFGSPRDSVGVLETRPSSGHSRSFQEINIEHQNIATSTKKCPPTSVTSKGRCGHGLRGVRIRTSGYMLL